MISIQIKSLQTQVAGALKNASANSLLQAASAADKKAEEKKAEEKKESTQVSLSDFGKRQLQALNMLKSLSTVQEARKNAARAQAAELKRRIDSLKAMAMMLGPMAAKGILRQIKQIAQQLRAVAAELAQPSASDTGGNGAPTVNASEGGENVAVDANVNSGAADEGGEGADAGEGAGNAQTPTQGNEAAEAAAAQQQKDSEDEDAEETDGADKDAEQAAAAAGAAASQAQQAASSAENEVKDKEQQEQNKGVGGNNEIANQHRARGEQAKQDAKLVSDLAKELRQLLNLVKSMLPRKDKEDKDNLKEIEKQLKETDKLVQQINAAANEDFSSADALASVDASVAEAGGAEGVDASVSADAETTVSISVYA